jgi:protein-tyrosine phosphatase
MHWELLSESLRRGAIQSSSQEGRVELEGLLPGVAERGSPENVGPISRYALAALITKGVTPEGAMRVPQPCSPTDFDSAKLVIALKEAEHRPLIGRRFPQFADRIVYWHVDDVEFMEPSIALAMIDDQVKSLLLSFGSQAR